MAAGIVASRRLRDLLSRRLTASNYSGLGIRLRLTGSSAQEEAPDHSYESLRVTSAQKHVLHVQLNRPNKRNAMNKAFWRCDLQILEACLPGEAGAAGLSQSGTLWGDGLEGRNSGQGFMDSDKALAGPKFISTSSLQGG
ncbi:PREDICTED: delta(3,5)-Delta(2,4)-dienoyl-CoA isomerase, mitochondrial-like [Mandrillus leucophaeus]|uniref:delta(3,5)-Delta(2,4)-dienoyl-CoA isomerase, mitochondrial-like n=1 Tax=Mandrillus leucophaeus TaxID=9568 RepID=UPI0005F5499D|nr:PREDICTED: delta(3,5)-Delta(2,4)-dienoyl-CoA isomerase, mitochondrial-like [Mandrillus leucophaeus]